MLRTDLTDHRGTDVASLVRAVADGDAIALAEAYHRTITAAHACARRLLASPVEIEALLRSVYSELWEEPPVDDALEGWVRARCFTLGTGYLRQRGLAAPSASLAAWTSGIEADSHSAGHDPLERMIAELTTEQQAALVRAHDQGLRTAEQEDADAGVALQHALLVLASPLTDDERHAAEMCSSGVALANWIFGLLPPHEAATVPGTAAEPTPCGRLAGVLRRARRRFEPLPPTPDLGHRVLAWVLSTSSVHGTGGMHASSLDTELRVASADLGRGSGDAGGPRSSLDMSLPASPPAEAEQQPAAALRRDNGEPREGWARPDADEDLEPDTGDILPTPLRSAGGPPALAGSTATPLAFSNAAPALAPDIVEDDGEELVRMPLRQTRRPAPAPTTDRDAAGREAREGDDTQTIRAAPDAAADADTVPPPAALRPAQDDDTHPPSGGRPQPAPSPLGTQARSPFGLDDDSAAPSPLTAEGRRGALTGHDMSGDSPLRRPAPAASATPARNRELDTEPRSPLERSEPIEDRALPARGRHGEPGPARSRDADATAQTPIQRDDSDPRIDELFGDAARDTEGRPSAPSGAQAADLTAPTLPAARRPTPPASPPAPRSSGPSTQSRPTPGGTQTAPTAPIGPAASSTDTEPGGGSSVLRWLVVVLLIAAGAAVGIFLGQMLI